MKSYTDIEQSKMLAAILPIESADMYWSRCTITDFCDGELKVSYAVEPCNISHVKHTKDDIPCWSLTALLQIIPKDIEGLNSLNSLRINMDDDFSIWYDDLKSHEVNDELPDITMDCPVDACVEMILKLKDMNVL